MVAGVKSPLRTHRVGCLSVKTNRKLVGHFKDVLNRPPPTVEADIQEAETDLDVNTTSSSKQEVVAATKSLKIDTVPGKDNLNAELFKADPKL